MKNQENQTPIELASAEDVKCLLQDAMTISISNQSLTSTSGLVCGLNSSNHNQSILVSPSTETETVTLPTGASMTLSVPVPLTPSRSCMSPAQGAESHSDGTCCESNETDAVTSVASFLIRYAAITLFEYLVLCLKILHTFELAHFLMDNRNSLNLLSQYFFL